MTRKRGNVLQIFQILNDLRSSNHAYKDFFLVSFYFLFFDLKGNQNVWFQECHWKSDIDAQKITKTLKIQ